MYETDVQPRLSHEFIAKRNRDVNTFFVTVIQELMVTFITTSDHQQSILRVCKRAQVLGVLSAADYTKCMISLTRIKIKYNGGAPTLAVVGSRKRDDVADDFTSSKRARLTNTIIMPPFDDMTPTIHHRQEQQHPHHAPPTMFIPTPPNAMMHPHPHSFTHQMYPQTVYEQVQYASLPPPHHYPPPLPPPPPQHYLHPHHHYEPQHASSLQTLSSSIDSLHHSLLAAFSSTTTRPLSPVSPSSPLSPSSPSSPPHLPLQSRDQSSSAVQRSVSPTHMISLSTPVAARPHSFPSSSSPVPPQSLQSSQLLQSSPFSSLTIANRLFGSSTLKTCTTCGARMMSQKMGDHLNDHFRLKTAIRQRETKGNRIHEMPYYPTVTEWLQPSSLLSKTSLTSVTSVVFTNATVAPVSLKQKHDTQKRETRIVCTDMDRLHPPQCDGCHEPIEIEWDDETNDWYFVSMIKHSTVSPTTGATAPMEKVYHSHLCLPCPSL